MWTLLVRGQTILVLPYIFVVCRWDNTKGADNICKQLGYAVASGTSYKAPGGTGPIQAGNRRCSGGEATIWDCPLQAGRDDTTKCTHDNDVGVNCDGTGPPSQHTGKGLSINIVSLILAI